MRDYETYYAMIEDQRMARPVTSTLNVPVEELPRLMSAAMAMGVTTEEFVEVAVFERLEKELGLWPYVILSRQLEPCFCCGEPTLLVDLGFEAPFCNSGICNWAIDEDLRMSSIRADYQPIEQGAQAEAVEDPQPGRAGELAAWGSR